MYDKNQSILPFGLIIINKKNLYFKIKVEVLFIGAEGGIRTLEQLLTVTRFPIVRARPTTRLLHVCSSELCLLTLACVL